MHSSSGVVIGLIALCVVTFGPLGAPRAWGGSDATDAPAAWPIEFYVPPWSRLYLNGERIDHVRMTLAAGDSLRLNGVPVQPVRGRRPSVPDGFADWDEFSMHTYRNVPYVQALVATGTKPGEAAASFNASRSKVWGLLEDAYAAARETGLDVAGAGIQAFAMLREADCDGLIDWGRRPAVVQNAILLYWKGLPFGDGHDLGRRPDTPTSPELIEKDKRLRAAMIRDALVGPKPCWCIIGVGGFGLYHGGEDLSRMTAELDEALRLGQARPVHLLNEAIVREILSADSGAGTE